MSEIKDVTLKFKCSQNWDAMQPVEGGRHCDVCNKKVVDFAGKSTSDIDKAMVENDGKVCGAFSNTTEVKVVGQNVFRWRNAAIVAGALQLMLACKPTRTLGNVYIFNADSTDFFSVCDSFTVNTRTLTLNPKQDSILNVVLPKITTPYTKLPKLKNKFPNPCPNLPLSDVLAYYSNLYIPYSIGHIGNFNITVEVNELGRVKQTSFDVTVSERVRKFIIKGSKKMRFEPAEKDGKKVPFTMVVPLTIYPLLPK